MYLFIRTCAKKQLAHFKKVLIQYIHPLFLSRLPSVTVLQKKKTVLQVSVLIKSEETINHVS